MKEHELIQELFSNLNFNDAKLKSEILSYSEIEYLPKNSEVIKQNQFVKWLVIILDGKIRVWHEHNERELTLYNIGNYETCAYSIVAIENLYQSQVNANCKCDTIVLKIPIQFVKKWKKHTAFNQFILDTLIYIYGNLLDSIRLLAFKKIDERVISYLTEEAEKTNSKEINISHNEIAKNIGTTREVVSKTLKNYENNGQLQLSFKKIKLL